jgi:hypothetical protein
MSKKQSASRGRRLTSEERAELALRRSTVSTAFIGILIALAIGVAFEAVREPIAREGITLRNFSFFGVLLLTTTRFFIGYQLHLTDPVFLKLPGGVWFLDAVIITVETLLLTFMAGISTVQRSDASRYGFIRLLVVLLMLDITWILLQWIAGLIRPAYQRKVLWGWLVSGVVLIALLYGIQQWYGDIRTHDGLFALLSINVLAFVFDIWIVDHYKLLDEGG